MKGLLFVNSSDFGQCSKGDSEHQRLTALFCEEYFFAFFTVTMQEKKGKAFPFDFGVTSIILMPGSLQ